MNTKTPLKWQRQMEGDFRLKDASDNTYAYICKSSAWRTKPYGWVVSLPHCQAEGRCKTVCCAKICAKKAVLKLLAMTTEERQCYTVIEYAKTKGVAKPTMTKHPVYGWMLYGKELDKTGYPIVWPVAEELGIWRGVGSTGQCQVDLSKLKVP